MSKRNIVEMYILCRHRPITLNRHTQVNCDFMKMTVFFSWFISSHHRLLRDSFNKLHVIFSTSSNQWNHWMKWKKKCIFIFFLLLFSFCFHPTQDISIMNFLFLLLFKLILVNILIQMLKSLNFKINFFFRKWFDNHKKHNDWFPYLSWSQPSSITLLTDFFVTSNKKKSLNIFSFNHW